MSNEATPANAADTYFKEGNRFWEARSTHGRTPTFKSSDDLLDACQQYFEWNADHPLWEAKVFNDKGTIVHARLPKMRAMTIFGLCNFLGIAETTWRNWRKDRPDFLAVMQLAEQVMRQQKFEGASADLLNANIIARDLGLADKSEFAGPNGGPLETETKQVDEFTSRITRLAARSAERE